MTIITIEMAVLSAPAYTPDIWSSRSQIARKTDTDYDNSGKTMLNWISFHFTCDILIDCPCPCTKLSFVLNMSPQYFDLHFMTCLFSFSIQFQLHFTHLYAALPRTLYGLMNILILIFFLCIKCCIHSWSRCRSKLVACLYLFPIF